MSDNISDKKTQSRSKSLRKIDFKLFSRTLNEIIKKYCFDDFCYCFTNPKSEIPSENFKQICLDDLKRFSQFKGTERAPAKTFPSFIFCSKQQEVRRRIMHRVLTWLKLSVMSNIYLRSIYQKLKDCSLGFSEFKDRVNNLTKNLDGFNGTTQVNNSLSTENFDKLRYPLEANIIYLFLTEENKKLYNFIDKYLEKLNINEDGSKDVFIRLSLNYIFSGLIFSRSVQDQKFFKSLRSD